MKTQEETGKAFADWVVRTLPPDHHDDVHKLFDEHCSVLVYEAQKSTLQQLYEHAGKHWGNVEHWSAVSEAVGAAWDHERTYIASCLQQLEDHFNPKAEENEYISILKSIFGKDVRIISMDDLFSNPEFLTEAVPNDDERITEDKFPQVNTFVGMRYEPTHRHIKTGNTYAKLGDASEEATMNHVVMYRNARGETFTRPVLEFMENFEELN